MHSGAPPLLRTRQRKDRTDCRHETAQSTEHTREHSSRYRINVLLRSCAATALLAGLAGDATAGGFADCNRLVAARWFACLQHRRGCGTFGASCGAWLSWRYLLACCRWCCSMLLVRLELLGLCICAASCCDHAVEPFVALWVMTVQIRYKRSFFGAWHSLKLLGSLGTHAEPVRPLHVSVSE